jgi:hypothetical protein
MFMLQVKRESGCCAWATAFAMCWLCCPLFWLPFCLDCDRWVQQLHVAQHNHPTVGMLIKHSARTSQLLLSCKGTAASLESLVSAVVAAAADSSCCAAAGTWCTVAEFVEQRLHV